MARTFGEYTTVAIMRERYADIQGAKDDALIVDFIREISRTIDAKADRFFYPLIQTRRFDAVRDVANNRLWLDQDLLAVDTLTNGDNTVITAAQYVCEPRNGTPIWGIQLKGSSGVTWTYDTDPENAIVLAGTWGYHTDYANAWIETGAVLAAAIASTSTTTFTCTTNKLKAGQLLKIDSEYLYLESIIVGTNDTVTVVRGVNGSTAATHLINAPIYAWDVDSIVAGLARDAVAAKYKYRDNPTGETLVIDGQSFQIPKDLDKWIEYHLLKNGLKR